MFFFFAIQNIFLAKLVRLSQQKENYRLKVITENVSALIIEICLNDRQLKMTHAHASAHMCAGMLSK